MFFVSESLCEQTVCDWLWMKITDLIWKSFLKKTKSNFRGFQSAFMVISNGSTADDRSSKLQKKECGAKYTFKFEEAEGIYQNFIIIRIRQKRVVGTDVKSNRLVETIHESQVCIGLRNM